MAFTYSAAMLVYFDYLRHLVFLSFGFKNFDPSLCIRSPKGERGPVTTLRLWADSISINVLHVRNAFIVSFTVW